MITLPPASGTFSTAEPGIAISAGGTAIANAASANTGAPPTAWISHDGGGSWGPAIDFDITGASTGDADAVIGADGYLYALNLAFENPPGQPANPTVFVFRSLDGSSWQGPATFPPPHGSDQPDRPWLVVDPQRPADVDVFHSEGGGNIVEWQSQDHGATFTGPITVSSGANSQAALALSSRPLFDPSDDSRIVMFYETVTAAGLASTLAAQPPVYEFPMTQIWMAVSSDSGATWSNQLVLDTTTLSGSPLQSATLGHLLVASAIDTGGGLYAAFSLRQNGATATAIYLMHSENHGASWSAPSLVSSPSMSNVMPALEVSGGNAYLSWYGTTDADFRDGNAVWYEMFAATPNPQAGIPSFDVAQVSAVPAHVGGINTAGNVGSNLGANWGLRDLQSIAVDACGLPHPIWAVDDGQPATMTASPDESATCSATTQVPEVPVHPLLVVSAATAVFVYGLHLRRRRRIA
ncbi:MAG TPA: sialidase family protein [Candidatus Dormibacteraeota bacterium]|nr:sialidase family protein [Candidatus Dormibacteraeota bacterium]